MLVTYICVCKHEKRQKNHYTLFPNKSLDAFPSHAMRRTKEQAEQTRGAILAAAEQMFLEKGVAHSSLEQIARAAGVTRGAVYWHFEDKAHLFHEMLSQVRLPPEQLAELFNLCDGMDPLLALRNLCIEAIESLARNEQKRRIFTILLHRCEFTDELREAERRHNAFINQFIDLTENLLARADCRSRLYPGMTPHLAARALHALLIGLFTDWTRDPNLFDPLHDTAGMIDAQLRGLLRDWQPPA